MQHKREGEKIIRILGEYIANQLRSQAAIRARRMLMTGQGVIKVHWDKPGRRATKRKV